MSTGGRRSSAPETRRRRARLFDAGATDTHSRWKMAMSAPPLGPGLAPPPAPMERDPAIRGLADSRPRSAAPQRPRAGTPSRCLPAPRLITPPRPLARRGAWDGPDPHTTAAAAARVHPPPVRSHGVSGSSETGATLSPTGARALRPSVRALACARACARAPIRSARARRFVCACGRQCLRDACARGVSGEPWRARPGHREPLAADAFVP